ncbi:helix-turn-helix domain-containing protein [Flagellimonas sp. CMM7]|uniref:helix-turn-helix domain-containing protein n=1 Tax=Flagellimonas sp. CMM7 TaxID=2654676 RepID=UPI0013D05525|nr:helix-turn-helix transcriptional regulator [Flagellimonas sp. CMM7]UII81510.1 helix-turn-helix domain-containing protein [Flagellimonas sp. CMM7]
MADNKKDTSEPLRKFAEKILEIRLKREMSQMDVGARIGIDRENIRKYEKGLQEPRLSTIVKFAEAFEIDYNELLGYEKE